MTRNCPGATPDRWYLSYEADDVAKMYIFNDRDAAIDVACDLLREGRHIDVVSPMRRRREKGGRPISKASLLKLASQRARSPAP